MCIIISKSAGVKALDPAYFDRAWDNNSHGGGLVWKNEGEDVYFQKGFMKKEDFLAKIAEVNKETTAFIAHFRIKSVGEVKPENCHPFVMEKVTFAHNGTLSIEPEGGMTDSETFGRAFLFDKDMKWIKEYKTLLEMALGTSKFAIMDNETGEILILNKEYGEEKDGAWFSNKSAFAKPVTFTSPTGWYKNYDNYTPIGFKGPDYKSNKDFGTKNMKVPAAIYCKDKGCFIYPRTGIICKPAGYKEPLAIGKRGLWQFAATFKPSKDYTDKSYTNNSYELKVISAYQTVMNRKLDAYRKRNFKTLAERNDAEEEIHAINFLLNGMRRLVSHKKVLSSDTIYDFCVVNVERETWANKVDTPFIDYVFLYADKIVAALDGAGMTKAQIVESAQEQDLLFKC